VKKMDGLVLVFRFLTTGFVKVWTTDIYLFLSFICYCLRSTVVNVKTNRCARILGKGENARFLQVSLFQGTANRPKAALTIDMEASDNPILKGVKFDPILFCSAVKKNRFYLFTTREPSDTDG